MDVFKKLKEKFDKKKQIDNTFITIPINKDWRNKKVLVVFSGGLDSTVLLHWAQKEFKEVEAISFDFKQKYTPNTDPQKITFQNNILEIKCAKKTAEKLKIKHTIVDVSFMDNILTEMRYREDNNHKKHFCMPYRNLILLSIASSIAETTNCDYILTGFQIEDGAGYWDTSQEFLKNLNNVIKMNPNKEIKIISPFLHLNKQKEIMLGLHMGVDFANTWSCYNPLQLNNKYICCNECPACYNRQLSFNNLNLIDPLEYFKKEEN